MTKAQAYIVPAEQAKQSHGGTLLTHILRKNVATCEVNISILKLGQKQTDKMYEFYCMMIILHEFNCSMTTFNCLLFCCSSREKKAPKKQGSALARPWFWEKHSQQSGLAARGLTYRHPQPSAEESV